MRTLTLLFILLLLYNSATSNYQKERKKFIYTVTEDIDKASYYIKFKIKDSTGKIRTVWSRNGRLFHDSFEKRGFSEKAYRKFIRKVLLEDTPIELRDYERDPPWQRDEEYEQIVDSIVRHNPNFIDELFDNRITIRLTSNYSFKKKLSIVHRLWDENIGVRDGRSGYRDFLLGYFEGKEVNKNIAFEREEKPVIRIDFLKLKPKPVISLQGYTSGNIPLSVVKQIDKVDINSPYKISSTVIYINRKDSLSSPFINIINGSYTSFSNRLKQDWSMIAVGDKIIFDEVFISTPSRFIYLLQHVTFTVTE